MQLTNCRICGSDNLKLFLDLGETPAADGFVQINNLSDERVFPLRVVLCEGCGMSQLDYTVPPEILYQQDYPYESSTTKTGRKHFHDMAKEVYQSLHLQEGALVIDIGSNVGVLLNGFQIQGCEVLGIEPAANIAEKAMERGVYTISEFVSPAVAQRVVTQFGKAKAICITNVFAHIHDLNELMSCVDLMLDKDGSFVIEAPHFLNLVNQLEYDTIYHEHLLYLTVSPLGVLFSKYGFEINSIKTTAIHGGSVRIYVSRVGTRSIDPTVKDIKQREQSSGLFELEKLREFSVRVQSHKIDLLNLLRTLKSAGKRIAAVSAPAKGMTLLNYCGIDRDLLEFVTEKSDLKVGKLTPGGHLPIVSDKCLIEQDIDYALLLAWNFKDEIVSNLEPFAARGGRFIVPIPEPHVI